MVNQLWPLSRFTWHYIWDDFKMCVRSYKIVIAIVSVKLISNYQLWVYPIQQQSSKLLHMQVQWCEKRCFCLKTSIEYTKYTQVDCRATFSTIWRMVFCRTSHHCGGTGTLFQKRCFSSLRFVGLHLCTALCTLLQHLILLCLTVAERCFCWLMPNLSILVSSHIFFQKSLICFDASMQNEAMQSCSF